MANESDELLSFEFTESVCKYGDLCFFIAKDLQLVEQDVNHSIVLAHDEGEIANALELPWNSFALSVSGRPDNRLVVVGEDGQTVTYIPDGSIEGNIEPQPRLIRRARTIAGYVYACGVGREVFLRQSAESWRNISAPPPETRQQPVAFEDITGFSEDEIYCCGWNGEIWQFDGATWADRSGVTNSNLTSMTCTPAGEVYVVGQKGVIIKGRNDLWQPIILEDDFEVDLWDIHWFNGEIYVTTMMGIYRLDGTVLEEITFEDDAITSFYRLSSADDVMWSVGRTNILSYDGHNWTRHR